ncbi:hypothetical protein EKK58_06610 [Candidatus Dependentiae bacterium]|nr:MAG: hypothetical protein EKK58_06610 [Candidatus Dependentiae bacterium]
MNSVKIFFLLINGSFFSFFFAMEQDLPLDVSYTKVSSILNYSIMPPFSKKEKKGLIETLSSNNKVLDKGMFTFYAVQACQKEQDNQKYYDYFLYKTYRYGQNILGLLENVSEAQTCLYTKNKKFITVKDITITAACTLCNKLQAYHLSKDTYLFTSKDMFYYSFLFAFLKDIRSNNVSAYCFSLYFELYDFLYKMFYENNELLVEQIVLKFFSLLKERDNQPLDINDIKSWHGQDSNFCILPFITKNGVVGVHTLMLAMANSYCPVGFGLTTTTIHNGAYKNSLISLTFHDFLHYFLMINDCKATEKPIMPTERIKTFYKNAIDAISGFINEYKDAQNHIGKQQNTLKKIFALFVYMHEMPASSDLFEKTYFAKLARIPILDGVKKLLDFELLYEEEDDDQLTPKQQQENLATILFNALDMIKLYTHAYPQIKTFLMENSLKIENGAIKNSQFPSEPVTLQQLTPIVYYLAWCMVDAWHLLVDEQQNYFDDTLVYKKLPLSVHADLMAYARKNKN